VTDVIRRSNWKDAGNVAVPKCPKCGSANSPQQSPIIERVNLEYVCLVCSHAWPVASSAA